jgi:hypothetical protein
MAVRQMWTVSFADIFRYAEKNFGMHWNKCNDVFFNDLFRYKGHRIIHVEDMEYELEPEEVTDAGLNEDQLTARKAIIAFMKDNNVKEMIVLGD